jgi:hypothetical protein
MTTSRAVKTEQGLGNRALLDKMDKLRELGISNMVPLPQVCSQSALTFPQIHHPLMLMLL